MIIALTGLHSAGKSFFTKQVPEKHGFKVINKKELVAQLCKEEANREDWNDWYREQFNKDPYEMTMKILKALPSEDNIILDSVHSNLEWKIIKEIIPDATLILITAFNKDRKERWNSEFNIEEKDNQRIEFWHSKNVEDKCLLTQVSWALNGSGTIELSEQNFIELVNYLKKNNVEDGIKIKRLIKKEGK